MKEKSPRPSQNISDVALARTATSCPEYPMNRPRSRRERCVNPKFGAILSLGAGIQQISWCRGLGSLFICSWVPGLIERRSSSTFLDTGPLDGGFLGAVCIREVLWGALMSIRMMERGVDGGLPHC